MRMPEVRSPVIDSAVRVLHHCQCSHAAVLDAALGALALPCSHSCYGRTNASALLDHREDGLLTLGRHGCHVGVADIVVHEAVLLERNDRGGVNLDVPIE